QRFGNPALGIWIRDYSLYVQDQYRLTSKLTANLGLRYEGARYAQPDLINSDYPQTARIPTTNKNFGPRAGLAYAVNQGKTVVRAGYGLFYARWTGGIVSTLHIDNGVYQRVYSLSGSRANELAAGPVFPNRLASGVDTRYGRVMLMDNGGNSYYNALAVQMRKRFSKGWQGSVAYTWSHAIDYNQGGGTNVVFLDSGTFLRTVNNADYRGE